MRRFVVVVCCLAPALILAGEKRCKLGSPLSKHRSMFGQRQLPPMDKKLMEHSSMALDFLKSCDSRFVEKYVERNHDNPTKMNPILKTLNMYSPMDWEILSEGTVVSDLNSERTKEELESCISDCNRNDEWEDVLGNSHEELLEDFKQHDAGSSKPAYSCPKCVQYLPANLLVNVPDVLWGLKSKPKPTTTTEFTPTTEAATTTAATTTEYASLDPKEGEFSPPKVTRTIKCGLRNNYRLQHGPDQLLYDPDNKLRFLIPGTFYGNHSDQGEFPWHASLRNEHDKKTFCGGTLINSWTVLTAAHCVHEGEGGDFLQKKFAVGLGWQKSQGGKKYIRDNPQNEKYGQQIINIDLDDPEKLKGRVFVHPGYIGEKRNDTTNVHSPDDIAIIVLPTEVEFPENADVGNFHREDFINVWDDNSPDQTVPRGTFVRPVCMPDPDKSSQVQVRYLHPWTYEDSVQGDKDNVWIIGFGKVNSTSLKKIKNLATSDWKGESLQLMKAYIAAMPNAQCQQRIRARADEYLVISPKQMCAMGIPSHIPGGSVVDTCQGDSGGPVVKMVDYFKEKSILENWTKDERDAAYFEIFMKTGLPPMRGQLLGVTSWGYGCGEGTPGIYTRVSEYLTWIKKYTADMSTPDDKIF